MGILSRGSSDVIVLDAILTDLGRQRLAAASSSTVDFDIVQFSASDDDIDYSVFDQVGANGLTFEDIVARVVRRNIVFEPATSVSTQSRNKLIRVPLNQVAAISTMPSLVLEGGSNSLSMVQGTSLSLTVNQSFSSGRIQPSLVDDSFFVEFNPRLIRLTSGGQSSSADITVDAFRVAKTRFVASNINIQTGSSLTMSINTVFTNFNAIATQFGVSGTSIQTAITIIGKNTGISKTITLTISNS